jgi:hypothetical protein
MICIVSIVFLSNLPLLPHDNVALMTFGRARRTQNRPPYENNHQNLFTLSCSLSLFRPSPLQKHTDKQTYTSIRKRRRRRRGMIGLFIYQYIWQQKTTKYITAVAVTMGRKDGCMRTHLPTANKQ